MHPAQIKVVIGLGIALALGVGIALFGQHYRNLQASAIQNENRGQVLKATSKGVSDGVAVDVFTQAMAAALASGRTTFQQTKSEAIRNEPETADRADRAVPDSVRNAARERRLARERSGCAGRECP